jgi:hypothetical protein
LVTTSASRPNRRTTCGEDYLVSVSPDTITDDFAAQHLDCLAIGAPDVVPTVAPLDSCEPREAGAIGGVHLCDSELR